MEKDPNAEHLIGKMLIAMPGMGDTRFEKSVIYICAHSEDGAMGLIVNKPTADVKFDDLLAQLDIDVANKIDVPVHYGGPVEHGRGFVLHTHDYVSEDSTLKVDDTIGMTATLDILEDISNGLGPDVCMLVLGYAGWGPGQLEHELQENGWLVCDASTGLVFSDDRSNVWTAAMDSLGIDPRMLSAEGGRA